MACWCETNDKEKTKSIADAEARISDLTLVAREHRTLERRVHLMQVNSVSMGSST